MITFELNKGEKVTVSSDDKDLTITVKESNKFPYKEGDYLISARVGGYTWFYVFKEFKNDTIYCYVSILNSDVTTIYRNEKEIPFSEIKETKQMQYEEAKAFISVLKGNGFKWNAKDKIVETVFKPGDVIKNESSTHYYIVLKISYDDIIVVNELGQELIGHTGNMFQTIEQEADLFFEDLRKNGLEYNATTNTVDKIKWVPAYSDTYFYIGAEGIVGRRAHANSIFDSNLIYFGNYFQTSKEAKEFLPKVQELYKNKE